MRIFPVGFEEYLFKIQVIKINKQGFLNINQKYQPQYKHTMDQDFFEEGEYQQATQSYHQQSGFQFQAEDNVWDYTQPQISNIQMETTRTLGSQFTYNSNQAINYNSATNVQVDDEVTRKIREQQERIQQVLREKANKEYEQKQARKEAGRAQITEFLQKKQRQLEQRRHSNIEHQTQLIQRAKQLNNTAGWNKVFENVNLKLGEYKGSKSVNRMREAIINKKEDQTR